MSKSKSHKKLSKLSKFVFNFLLISTITTSFFGITRIINLGPDTFLLKQYFAIRGDREAPDNVIIVSADATSFAKLNLSFKRPFDQKILLETLNKILSANPKNVFVDARFFNDTGSAEEKEKLSSLRSLDSVQIYQESLLTKDGLNTDESTELIVSLDLSKGLLSKFSNKEALYNELKLENVSKRDLLINFYGAPDTIKKVYLHQLLTLEDTSMLKDQIIILSIENIIKDRGYIDSTHIATVAASQKIFSSEILASMIANLLDGSAIKTLPLKSALFCILIISLVCAVILSFFSIKKGLLVLAAMLFVLNVGLFYLLFSAFIFIEFSLIFIAVVFLTFIYALFKAVFAFYHDTSSLKKQYYID